MGCLVSLLKPEPKQIFPSFDMMVCLFWKQVQYYRQETYIPDAAGFLTSYDIARQGINGLRAAFQV